MNSPNVRPSCASPSRIWVTALPCSTKHVGLVAWNAKFQEIFAVPDALLEERKSYADYIRYLAARGDYGPEIDVEAMLRQFSETAHENRAYERTRPDGRVVSNT